MLTRVTDQMRFSIITDNMMRIKNSHDKVLEQISSQKKINRPSDDPFGMSKVLDYRTTKASIERYQRNIDNADAWVKMTETSLTQMSDLIAQARQIGMSYEDNDQKDALAESVRLLMDAVMQTGNTKMGDRYMFAGSRTDTQPFESVTDPTVTAAGGNVFDGSSLVGGVYTGNANHNYVLAITGTGAFGVATYNIDGVPQGTVPSSGTINVGQGLKLTFGEGTALLTVGDTFTVQATTSAAIEAPVKASENTYAGTVTSGTGPYTGTKNKTYAVKITGAGGLGVATYNYSADGGKNWIVGGIIPAPGTITLAEGVSLSFTAGTFAVNDIFSVNAKAPGYYNGNGDDLTLDIGQGRDVAMNYNISGEEALTDRGKGAGFPDVLANLQSLRMAIKNGDSDGVSTFVNNLKEDQTRINTLVSQIGLKEQGLKTWKDNYTTLDNKISDLKSTLEDTDMAKMITDYQMKETALEAAYAIASKIGSQSILDFLT